MEQSCGFRCGISLPFQRIPANFCDIPSVHNYSVPGDAAEVWRTASGSMSFDENAAIMGAIGESLERYSGAVCGFEAKPFSALKNERVIPLDEFSLFSEAQYGQPGFAWKKPAEEARYFGKMHSLYDNEEVYVPQELIGLGSRTGKPCVPSTSTGLAAHTSAPQALISALLEVLERDALAVYWLHSLGGRKIALEKKYTREVETKGGCVTGFDITQDWNPFPVVIVCGWLLSGGMKRISMGVACRENYGKAIEKAYLEWIQGCVFAGYYHARHPNLTLGRRSDVTSFDLHAVYYTKHPEQWEKVPLIRDRLENGMEGGRPCEPRDESCRAGTPAFQYLLKRLKKENIRLLYKDMTPVDVREAGVSVMRVVSPDLSPIHGDENMPFLGGRPGDLAWRYAGMKGGQFPNEFPHPLG